MAVLVDEDFSEDAGGFSAGSQVASEGADYTDGYLSIPGNTTSSKTFTAVTSGNAYCSFWVNPGAADLAANDTTSTFVYFLPTAGAVSSANSVATLLIGKNSARDATASRWTLEYRTDSAILRVHVDAPLVKFAWSQWFKFAVNVDLDAGTYDLYINDVLWIAAIPIPNAAAADFSRVVILNNTAAANPCLFDNIYVESGWSVTDDDVTVVEHDFTADSGQVEALTPDTNNRNIHNQPWRIADDTTTYGAFQTSGSNGLAPDASKHDGALIQCLANGVMETEWQTSVADDIYLGTLFRRWGGIETSESFYFRYYSEGAALWVLAYAGTAVATSDAVTLSANTTVTLKVEVRGRYVLCSVKEAAMDAGSYTLLFTHLIDSIADGKGQLSEEHCGFFMPMATAGIGADNYVRKFRFTGTVPSQETSVVVSDNTWKLCPGSVREWYQADTVLPQRNLFWSKGIQLGHRSNADMGNHVIVQATEFSGDNVKSYKQRGINVSEIEIAGIAEIWATFTRRGVWCSEGLIVMDDEQNFAPDLDLHGGLWDPDLKTIGPTGDAVDDSDSPFHDWTEHHVDKALPLGIQSLTAHASGNQVRLTEVARSIVALTGNVHDLQSKFRGRGDPISRIVLTRREANIVDLTHYRCGRFLFVQSGALSLDDSLLETLRDDIASPAAFTFTTGSAKTDAVGDTDADGFNERFGWYEVTAEDRSVDCTLVVDSITREYPQIRISGASANSPVLLDGSAAIEGTDYVLDGLGDGTVLLQILSSVSSDLQITVLSNGEVRVAVTDDLATTEVVPVSVFSAARLIGRTPGGIALTVYECETAQGEYALCSDVGTAGVLASLVENRTVRLPAALAGSRFLKFVGNVDGEVLVVRK